MKGMVRRDWMGIRVLKNWIGMMMVLNDEI
jgi:hypothetical protein